MESAVQDDRDVSPECVTCPVCLGEVFLSVERLDELRADGWRLDKVLGRVRCTYCWTDAQAGSVPIALSQLVPLFRGDGPWTPPDEQALEGLIDALPQCGAWSNAAHAAARLAERVFRVGRGDLLERITLPSFSEVATGEKCWAVWADQYQEGVGRFIGTMVTSGPRKFEDGLSQVIAMGRGVDVVRASHFGVEGFVRSIDWEGPDAERWFELTIQSLATIEDDTVRADSLVALLHGTPANLADVHHREVIALIVSLPDDRSSFLDPAANLRHRVFGVLCDGPLLSLTAERVELWLQALVPLSIPADESAEFPMMGANMDKHALSWFVGCAGRTLDAARAETFLKGLAPLFARANVVDELFRALAAELVGSLGRLSVYRWLLDQADQCRATSLGPILERILVAVASRSDGDSYDHFKAIVSQHPLGSDEDIERWRSPLKETFAQLELGAAALYGACPDWHLEAIDWLAAEMEKGNFRAQYRGKVVAKLSIALGLYHDLESLHQRQRHFIRLALKNGDIEGLIQFNSLSEDMKWHNVQLTLLLEVRTLTHTWGDPLTRCRAPNHPQGLFRTMVPILVQELLSQDSGLPQDEVARSLACVVRHAWLNPQAAWGPIIDQVLSGITSLAPENRIIAVHDIADALDHDSVLHICYEDSTSLLELTSGKTFRWSFSLFSDLSPVTRLVDVLESCPSKEERLRASHRLTCLLDKRYDPSSPFMEVPRTGLRTRPHILELFLRIAAICAECAEPEKKRAIDKFGDVEATALEVVAYPLFCILELDLKLPEPTVQRISSWWHSFTQLGFDSVTRRLDFPLSDGQDTYRGTPRAELCGFILGELGRCADLEAAERFIDGLLHTDGLLKAPELARQALVSALCMGLAEASDGDWFQTQTDRVLTWYAQHRLDSSQTRRIVVDVLLKRGDLEQAIETAFTVVRPSVRDLCLHQVALAVLDAELDQGARRAISLASALVDPVKRTRTLALIGEHPQLAADPVAFGQLTQLQSADPSGLAKTVEVALSNNSALASSPPNAVIQPVTDREHQIALSARAEERHDLLQRVAQLAPAVAQQLEDPSDP